MTLTGQLNEKQRKEKALELLKSTRCGFNSDFDF